MGVLTMWCRSAPGQLRGSRLNWNGTFDGQNWKCSPRKACGHREQVVVSGRSNKLTTWISSLFTPTLKCYKSNVTDKDLCSWSPSTLCHFVTSPGPLHVWTSLVFEREVAWN